MKYYFAWVESQAGSIWPHKWAGELHVDQKPAPSLFKVEITEHDFDNIPLDELVKRYPLPEEYDDH